MTHICPVCRAKLWRRPFARRLRCPRCGVEFRPTVSLFYFQILFLLFLLVCLAVVVVLSGNYPWLGAIVGLLVLTSIVFLPRLVRLEPDSRTLPVAEGPTPEDLHRLPLEDWEDSDDSLRPSLFLTILIVFSAVILGWLILRFLV
jgi:hypothetical protein